jgi:hypothetical protein
MTSSRFIACAALALLVVGCASEPGFRSGRSKYEMGNDRYGPVREPDPNRRISDQDCTKRVVIDGGNLRCM